MSDVGQYRVASPAEEVFQLVERLNEAVKAARKAGWTVGFSLPVHNAADCGVGVYVNRSVGP